MAEAISSGSALRPAGVLSAPISANSGCFAITASSMGVRVPPGPIALMRIPEAAHSIPAERVKPATPCLLAL